MTKEEYVEEIRVKMQELKGLCLTQKIPMLCFVALDDKESESTTYESVAVTPLEAGVELCDDRVTRLSAALGGSFDLRVKNTFSPYQDSISEALDYLLDDDE